MLFTRISFIYLLTCCQGGLKTCFVFLSSLSISYYLLFQSRLYKSANNNYGWVKSRRVMSVSVLISSWFELQWSILPSHQILLRTDEIWPSYSIFLTFGWFSGWLVGWFGWLAGSYHLDSFRYCKSLSPKLPFQILSKSDENCRFYSRSFGHYHRVFSEKRWNVETL